MKHNARIVQEPDGSFTLEMRTLDGYTHYIDPFVTYNEAYEYYMKYYNNQDDLK